jgi:hypothetical protein
MYACLSHITKKETRRMSEIWLQEYIFLVFRLDKEVETACGSPFVEEYWGPPAWSEQVEAEPEIMAADLMRQAMALVNAKTDRVGNPRNHMVVQPTSSN